MTPRYVVTPRKDGRGFTLTGPGLPYPLRYRDDLQAIDYARHMMRDTGGKVIILDSRGWCIITETVEGTPGRATAYW